MTQRADAAALYRSGLTLRETADKLGITVHGVRCHLDGAGVAYRKAQGDAHPCNTDEAYTADEEEFLRAVVAWQVRKRRKFPTFSEILGIVRGLGYAKAAEPTAKTEAEA